VNPLSKNNPTPLSKLDDSALMELARVGDMRAFEILIKRHRSKMLATILQVVKDREMAEDLYQDALLKIYQVVQAGEYDEKGKFLPWALRVARNLAIDQFRRERRNPQINAGDNTAFLDYLHHTDHNQERKLVQDENRRMVRKLIRMLPDKQREVLIMRHYNQMSFKEIAEMTDVSINTALGRMRYALVNLRKLAEERGVV
jgi:RNA polymerase sigma-70 factor (ECF subfamily)